MLSLDFAVVTLGFALFYGFAVINKDQILTFLTKYGFFIAGMITAFQMLVDYASPLAANLALIVFIILFVVIFALDLFLSFIPILKAFWKKRR